MVVIINSKFYSNLQYGISKYSEKHQQIPNNQQFYSALVQRALERVSTLYCYIVKACP